METNFQNSVYKRIVIAKSYIQFAMDAIQLAAMLILIILAVFKNREEESDSLYISVGRKVRERKMLEEQRLFGG